MHKTDWLSLVPDKVSEEISEDEERLFLRVVSTELSPEEESRVVTVGHDFPKQESVLAVHWHPEFVPKGLIRKRIAACFPHKQIDLIIPTQHNALTSWNGYTGVEVDCYSRGFNQKVQLLLHFETPKLEHADVLRSMLRHTFKYRSSQLYEFMQTITGPVAHRIEFAAKETGANETLIHFVQVYVGKIETLLQRHESSVPPESIKNKLLRNFFDGLRADYGDPWIDRAQTFLTAVKRTVKEEFPLRYFYRTSEVIEEARSLGGGIVIPHPEQFWPILLAEYDVDGYEVWNPQSRKYTKFLISVLNGKNKRRGPSHRPLLVFMGDDTHMAEKLRSPGEQDPIKASREVGFQPAWEDYEIRKELILANMDRTRVIREYAARLAG